MCWKKNIRRVVLLPKFIDLYWMFGTLLFGKLLKSVPSFIILVHWMRQTHMAVVTPNVNFFLSQWSWRFFPLNGLGKKICRRSKGKTIFIIFIWPFTWCTGQFKIILLTFIHFFYLTSSCWNYYLFEYR